MIVIVRTKGKGKKNSLFTGPSKYKRLASIVKMDSIYSARDSVSKLSQEWNFAKTREKKRRLISTVNQTRGRIKAMLKRKDVKYTTKQRLRGIYKIYESWSDRHRLRRGRP